MELDPGESGEIVEEGYTIPLAQTEPNVQLRPDPRVARRRHAQLPDAPDPGRREGPRGPRRGAVGGPAALRAARPRPGAHQHAAREAAREHQPRDLQLRRPVRGARPQRYPPGGLRLVAEPGVRRVRGTRRRTCARRCRSCPPRSTETRSALASGQVLAEELGPASEALIPAAQAFDAGPGRRAAPGAGEPGPDRRPDPAVHPPDPQAVAPPEPGRQAAGQDGQVDGSHLQRTEPALQRLGVTTRRAPRRATCSGPRG